MEYPTIPIYTIFKGVETPMQSNNTTEFYQCQEPPPTAVPLEDGRAEWRLRKLANERLSLAFQLFDVLKAERLAGCSSFLQFRVYEDGTKKLQSMNSCHVRLCPLCSWRRSLKAYSNVIKCATYLQEHSERRFVFLTLTIANCTADNLNKSINILLQGFNRLNQLKAFKTAFTGFYRGLEITHNINPQSKDFDTYHPHLHILLSVKKSYFTSRYYISQKELAEMWKQSARLDYDPVIDVRKLRGELAKACAEVAKYAVKENDIVIPEDWDLTVETAQTLDKALNGRRLISYGGEFAETKKRLSLEDEETGDLVVTDGKLEEEKELEYKIVNYFWFSGYRDYFEI